MNLALLADSIKHLNYVVMRNWEKMPPEGDIDFFVHPDHLQELSLICRGFFDDPKWYDIRTVGDNYYSKYIENGMLYLNGREYNGFKILSPHNHFISLYYHNLVHKGDGRYDEQLKKIFWEWQNPPQPEDEGVGYHDISKN